MMGSDARQSQTRPSCSDIAVHSAATRSHRCAKDQTCNTIWSHDYVCPTPRSDTPVSKHKRSVASPCSTRTRNMYTVTTQADKQPQNRVDCGNLDLLQLRALHKNHTHSSLHSWTKQNRRSASACQHSNRSDRDVMGTTTLCRCWGGCSRGAEDWGPGSVPLSRWPPVDASGEVPEKAICYYCAQPAGLHGSISDSCVV